MLDFAFWTAPCLIIYLFLSLESFYIHRTGRLASAERSDYVGKLCLEVHKQYCKASLKLVLVTAVASFILRWDGYRNFIKDFCFSIKVKIQFKSLRLKNKVAVKAEFVFVGVF